MRTAMLWKGVLGVLAVVAVTGCASMANKPPVDQKAGVKKVMEKWEQGIENKNVELVMAVLSPEAFTSSEFGGYAEFRENLTRYVAEGNLDGAQVNFNSAQITVEDDKATVYPVDVKTQAGEATLSFQLVRVDGDWLIVSMEEG